MYSPQDGGLRLLEGSKGEFTIQTTDFFSFYGQIDLA
jgi:hypothetical protein